MIIVPAPRGSSDEGSQCMTLFTFKETIPHYQQIIPFSRFLVHGIDIAWLYFVHTWRI